MSLESDLRFALRQLRKTPGGTLIIIATLALCIGANTAVFSIVNALLVRPLPYPDPSRLALVSSFQADEHESGLDTSQDGTQVEALRDHATDLEIAVYGLGGGANFSWHGQAEFIQAQRVSTGYFHVLGIAPQIGREFNRLEDSEGGPAAAVLSYEFWHEDISRRSANCR